MKAVSKYGSINGQYNESENGSRRNQWLANENSRRPKWLANAWPESSNANNQPAWLAAASGVAA
jgi:hypothetical protein